MGWDQRSKLQQWCIVVCRGAAVFYKNHQKKSRIKGKSPGIVEMREVGSCLGELKDPTTAASLVGASLVLPTPVICRHFKPICHCDYLMLLETQSRSHRIVALTHPHPTDMNATLRDQLILLEQQFLIAFVAQDETALQEFSLELPRLINHFKAAEASGDLDDDTAILLSRISQSIKATTQCVLECEDILKDAQAGLMSCFNLPLPSDDLLLPVSTSPPTFTPHYLLFSHISSSGALGILGHNKLLDACAYRWLRQNIHNPYPTSTQLQLIGDESMTSVAQAGRWFQEARDAIGWTKLSDEFFTGALNATITAAKQFYLEHDKTIPFVIAFAFSKVKAFMETLFAEHPTSPTPITSHVGSDQALRPGQDLFDNDELEDTTPPPPVAGCKRNHSEDSATSLASDLHRPLKRLWCVHLLKPTRGLTCNEKFVCGSAQPRQVHPSNTSIRASTHTSAIPVTSIQPSDPSFPVESKADYLALNSIGQRQTDLYDSGSEKAVISSDLPTSHNKMHQQNQEVTPQVPSERHLNTSVNYTANHTWDQSPGSVPTFAWPMLPSLDHTPTDFTGASQITVRPDASVDLGVFDWNSISNPLVKTPISMSTSHLLS